MTGKQVVVQSINLEGEMRCVDIFRRPDGTFGFEEYRRDAEDSRGWYKVAVHGARSFATETDAVAAARAAVSWLATQL